MKQTQQQLADKMTIAKALIDAGILPANCIRFTLCIPPDEPMWMSLEVELTEEQSAAFARVFVEHADEMKAIQRDTRYRDPDGNYHGIFGAKG